MATRTAVKMQEAFVQYSKKMCTRVCIFWMFYRLANFIVVLIRPETATALVNLVSGVDTVMLVNMGVYTGNSVTEKVALAYQKTHGVMPMEEKKEEKDEETEESNG